MVVHAPGLTSVCASWARKDEDAVWLGDDPEEALAHLLGLAVRDAALDLAADEDAALRSREARRMAEALSVALNVPIATNLDVFSDGARTERQAAPVVPVGWLFEECNDGIGVLAPVSAFDPDLEPIEEGSLFDLERELARADALLARGFAGSALAEARNTYHSTALDSEHLAAVARMRAAYEALGRDFLVRRVDRYVARHRAMS
jgi:hypothetical protein